MSGVATRAPTDWPTTGKRVEQPSSRPSCADWVRSSAHSSLPTGVVTLNEAAALPPTSTTPATIVAKFTEAVVQLLAEPKEPVAQFWSDDKLPTPTRIIALNAAIAQVKAWFVTSRAAMIVTDVAELRTIFADASRPSSTFTEHVAKRITQNVVNARVWELAVCPRQSPA